ncbi:MAG: sulfatase [Acidobacteriota bacterium]
MIFLAGCAPSAEMAPSAPVEKPFGEIPGVVLILIDTLRADHLGGYGSRRELTPHLDRLAEEGIVFENAIAPSAWTRSSVAAMFTSRYPSSIGVLGREDAIAPEAVTLAEALRDRGGFQTIAVSTNKNAGRPFGFAQGFDRFEVPDLYAGYPGDYEIHTAEGVTLKALQMVDELRPGQPFFLFLHYVDPHDPYLPHPGLLAEPEPPGRFNGSRADLQRLDRLPASERTADDLARIRHLYAGEVKYCDHWFGRLREGMAARGLDDKVLWLVTSDHGEGLWDHGLRGHGYDLYEEMIHVPLILKAPTASGPPSRPRVTEPVSLIDVAPTVLRVVGLPPPADFRGADLLAVENRSRRQELVYSEVELDGLNYEALRQRSLKLIRNRSRVAKIDALELYDLEQDPSERTNLHRQRNRERSELTRLLGGLAKELQEDVIGSGRIGLDELDDETRKGLQALGYLGSDGRVEGRSRRPSAAGPDQPLPVLDFTREDHPSDQVLEGYYAPERGCRWMAGRSSALLGRVTERQWRIKGWVDLAAHGRDELTLTLQFDGEGGEVRTVRESGWFRLEGGLPPWVLGRDRVRLDIECDNDFAPPGGDRRSLCAVIESIGFYE